MALSEYRGRPWFLVNYRTVIWSGEKNKIKKKKKEKTKKKKTSTNLFDRAYGIRDKLFCATFSFALIIFFPLNLCCHFVISIYQYSRNFSLKFSSDFIASIHVSISQHLFLPFAQRREFWNRTSFGATLTLKPDLFSTRNDSSPSHLQSRGFRDQKRTSNRSTFPQHSRKSKL